MGVARLPGGALGAHARPSGRRNFFGRNLQGKVVSAPQAEQESNFRGHFFWAGEISS